MNRGDDFQAAWDHAQALIDRRDREALVALTGSDDEDRREAAVYGLGRLGDPRDLPLLASLLADIYVNEAAQKALEDVGPAAEQVLTGAIGDPHGDGVLFALEALRAVGGAAAVPAVARCLRDGGRSVRSWAIEALSDIGERGAPAAWEALRAHAAVETDPDLRDLLAAVLPVPRDDPGPA